MATDKFIKDFYYEFYMAQDKEGKKRPTQHVNVILEVDTT